MIDLSNPNISLADFHVVGEANSFDWEHKKVARVPFCRLKPGQEIFQDRDYKVTILPKELYELFQSKI